MASKEITYKIEDELLVLSTKGSWSLELNLVSWNGAPAVYDLRKWNEDHTRMGKGITLTETELNKLASYVLATEED